MIELKLNEKQGRYVAAGMAVLAGLMAVSLVYQAAMHLVWRSWLKEASAVLVVLVSPAPTACDPPAPKDRAPILLFTGGGTSHGDVAAFERVLDAIFHGPQHKHNASMEA